MMNPQRRKALHRLGTRAAIAAALAAGVLRPSHLLAAWNQPAFDARKLPEALAALGIERPAATRALRIEVSDVVDNGAFVPIEIASELLGTESLALFVDRNPWPFIARFDVSRGALPAVSLRVRTTPPHGTCR
jgi:sulfur-oxidizing protein SoxY